METAELTIMARDSLRKVVEKKNHMVSREHSRKTRYMKMLQKQKTDKYALSTPEKKTQSKQDLK